jgi:hypothetical protein
MAADKPGTCPECGGHVWVLKTEFEDTAPTAYDEGDATATNNFGHVVAERIDKTDLNTIASLS